MVQEYCIEEAVEWAVNYVDPSNPIGIPKSRHEGRLTEKRTFGKKSITLYPNLFCRPHFHVLQHMSLCPSTWMSTRRCFLETIMGAMNHG
jgi:hypothetical protein